ARDSLAGSTSKDPAILAPRYLWPVYDGYGVSTSRQVQHVCAPTDSRCVGSASESRIVRLARPSGCVCGGTSVLPDSTAQCLAWLWFAAPPGYRTRRGNDWCPPVTG